MNLPDWIISDIVGETKNRSARINELILKGWAAEKDKEVNKKIKESPLFRSLTRNLKENNGL